MSDATQKYSITMPRDIAERARSRSGPSGLSSYVAAAVARQLERDNLNDLIEEMLCATALASPGPVTIFTSDPDDLRKLCGDRATVIKI
ncbi:hypothetical protein ACWGSK_05960 [Nocardiopsis sp. NPDC055551]